MEFRVLGPVEVVVEQARLALGSVRQRTILAVLLCAGEVVSADRLIEAVWGTRPPAASTKTLRSHISQLRRELGGVESGGDSAIVTAAGGYGLELGGHDLDADSFEELTRRAGIALPDNPATAEELLDEALSCWRGSAFGELGDHPMVRAEAVRLERLRATAAADRIDARLALGRHREVLGELEAAVLTEPLDERAHGQLMIALYRTGRQGDALAVYEALRTQLADGLGVDPSPDLQRLHRQLLRQEIADTGEYARSGTSTGSRPSPSPATGTFRQPLGSQVELFGREETLGAVAELVVAHPLVTVTGPGGVGKTCLAAQVGRDVADRFADGVVACGLSAVRDPASVASAVVAALGIEQPSTHDPRDGLAAAIGERRVLLLLDNCEHLLGSVADLVGALLHACPRLGVLATSREPMGLPGERVWQLAPLLVPRPDANPEEIRRCPAGALFVVRAEAAEPSFALSEENAAPVAELCRRLDGLPLAIELAASRVRALAPADLAARLDERFSLLATGPAGGSGRHRTLEGVVAWSHELLDDAQARMFDRLSVFAGSFALESAEQVCAGPPLLPTDVAGLLADLVDRSMVTVERIETGTRYRLLDTLRDYGARQLAGSEVETACRRAHADHHVALVEDLGPRLRGPHERVAVGAIEDAIDDLRVAHDWLVDEGDVDGALRLPAALHEYLLFRLRAEVFLWAERALVLPGADACASYPAALAAAALGAANRGELDRARGWAEVALERDEGLAALRALGTLSAVALYEGRVDDVLALAARLAALAETRDEPYYLALSNLDPALASHYRGEHEAATAHAIALEQAATAAASPTVRAWAAYVRGEISMDADPALARPYFVAAVEAAREAGSRLPEGVALVSLASVCARAGETREALERFREAVWLWRRLGDHTHQLTTLRNLVEVLVEVGADEDAALLHGAVATASPPSFGAEADRLERARVRFEGRLGAEAVASLARDGRDLGPDLLVDAALIALDGLLED
jgi:predicted ATPase/DNA-binding SARP family transcriptional activator